MPAAPRSMSDAEEGSGTTVEVTVDNWNPVELAVPKPVSASAPAPPAAGTACRKRMVSTPSSLLRLAKLIWLPRV